MLVSILSAVRNEQAHIQQMIDSVIAQSYSQWELLFVDDGSSDDTPEIVRANSEREDRVKLVATSERLGKVQAFNAAHQNSIGECIVLLAGDDCLPRDSIANRVSALSGVDSQTRAVAFFKLRTFSDDRKFEGMVLPRGRSGSRSGGCITMTRALADEVFPIDPRLVSEDIWLAYAAVGRASTIINSDHIVLNYRIHDNNSNPRRLPFQQMSASIANRARAYDALLAARYLQLPDDIRNELAVLVRAEQLRASGQTARLLADRKLPFADRAALASMSDPRLYRLRTRLYHFFSGRRGR